MTLISRGCKLKNKRLCRKNYLFVIGNSTSSHDYSPLLHYENTVDIRRDNPKINQSNFYQNMRTPSNRCT